MHQSALGAIIIDCQGHDLQRSAKFWSHALGLPLAQKEHSPYQALKTLAGRPEIEIQQVDHPSRVHLDIKSDDVEAEVQRLERLGAKRIKRYERWWVMEAPSGQRFCVVQLKPGQDVGTLNTWASDDRLPIQNTQAVLKHFDEPDELIEFEKGCFELVRVGPMTIGRATYQPGWKWSRDVGLARAQAMCQVEHVGMVLSGHAVAAYEDGQIDHLTAGTLFYIPPRPHDSWVVGEEPYQSLHFLGATHYTK